MRSLWAVLEAGATDRQRATISARIEDAKALLSLVHDSFPRYTLHDQVHAQNVVRNIELLLGAEYLGKLTTLEAAMLLLGAYYHDIGMVVKPEELSSFREEPEFQRYLQERPSDYVKAQQTPDKAESDLAEDYFRWRHADRVHMRINEMDPDLFLWNSVPLQAKLIDLCRSHALSAKDLQFLPIDFLGSCDLRACAVLLRIADIVDFDNSRTPETLYQHLKIDSRSSFREARSHEEWKKHMSAGGFTFPDGPRHDQYPLYFGAGPKTPAVEYEIRSFLDVIDSEVLKCRPVLGSCQLRWRDLPLPGPINREGIQSSGYKYRDLKFTLEREAVLDLFVGDKLYADSDVFVRELLQNSIDACRLRKAYDTASEMQGPDIEVTTWRGQDGEEWVRIDDKGIGMDEDIIERYLLRVGRSYYTSVDFEADLLRHGVNAGQRITPISRFGIGILSCFLIGDLVEISTRRFDPRSQAVQPVRLTISGVSDFVTIQAGLQAAKPMPSATTPTRGYRAMAGTSIAVRLDPRRIGPAQFDPEDIKRFLFAPNLRISINNRDVSGISNVAVERPPIQLSTSPLPEDFQRKADYCFGSPSKVQLVVVPLDLTANSPTSKLRGQVVVVGVEFADGVQPSAVPIMSDVFNELQLTDDENYFISQHLRLETSVDIGTRSAGNQSGSQRNSGEVGCIHLRADWTINERTVEGNIESLTPDLHGSSHITPLRGDLFKVRHEYVSQLNWEYSNRWRRYASAKENRPLTVRGAVTRDALKALLRAAPKGGNRDSWQGLNIAGFVAEIPLAGLLPKSDFFASEIKRLSLVGHNGIRLPSSGRDVPQLTAKSDYAPGWGSAAVFGGISLTDELRPELTLSRDEVKGYTTQTYSAIYLANRRAALALGRNTPEQWKEFLIGHHDPFGRYPGVPASAMADFDSDSLICQDDGWPIEKIFESTSGEQLSIAEIRLSKNPLHIILPSGRLGLGDSFMAQVQKALLQRNTAATITTRTRGYGRYTFDLRKSYGDLIVRVEADRPMYADLAFKYFTPMQFAQYEDRNLFCYVGAPLNRAHPVSDWIISQTRALAEQYPRTFSSLRQALDRIKVRNHSVIALGGNENLNERLQPLREVVEWIRGNRLRGIEMPPSMELEVEANRIY